MQMVQIWDMVQKVLAFYCWQDETEPSSIWGVQSVYSQNTASVTPLVSHLLVMEDVSFDKDVCVRCFSAMTRPNDAFKRERKLSFLINTCKACDHPSFSKQLWHP